MAVFELWEAQDRIGALKAENAKLKTALKRILATPVDDWQFRDGKVVAEVHLIAAAAVGPPDG